MTISTENRYGGLGATLGLHIILHYYRSDRPGHLGRILTYNNLTRFSITRSLALTATIPTLILSFYPINPSNRLPPLPSHQLLAIQPYNTPESTPKPSPTPICEPSPTLSSLCSGFSSPSSNSPGHRHNNRSNNVQHRSSCLRTRIHTTSCRVILRSSP